MTKITIRRYISFILHSLLFKNNSIDINFEYPQNMSMFNWYLFQFFLINIQTHDSQMNSFVGVAIIP